LAFQRFVHPRLWGLQRPHVLFFALYCFRILELSVVFFATLGAYVFRVLDVFPVGRQVAPAKESLNMEPVFVFPEQSLPLAAYRAL
jgi:hypothetical protein